LSLRKQGAGSGDKRERELFQEPPLKVRGARGVMKRMQMMLSKQSMVLTEVTPFIPLTLRGRFREPLL
jgi:hypothetical protein